MARLLGGVAAMGAFALATSTANVATITVTTDLDEFDSSSPNATCSLREAIESANRNNNFGGCMGSSAYTIVFAPNISVITLTITSLFGINNDNNAYLDLDVVVDSAVTNIFTLTIQGGANNRVKIVRDYDSAPQFSDRIFDILTPTLGLRPGGVRFAYLFIEAGQAVGNEETVSNDHPCHQGGAGVRHRSGGLLEIESGTVSFNFANGNGGGICQDGGQLRVLNYTYIAKNTSKFYQRRRPLYLRHGGDSPRRSRGTM